MKRAAEKKGLTLIELVMAIVIVGILVGASTLYIRQVIDLWSFISFRNEVVAQGRLAVTRMSRELRQIKNSTAVAAAERERIVFTDANDLVINYSRSGNDLLRNGNILASGVGSLSLSYYNLSNSPLLPPLDAQNLTQIRRIGVTMNMTSGTQQRRVRTQVYPRNL